MSIEEKRREPGRFVKTRWRLFVYIGVGIFALLFVPGGVGRVMNYLVFVTAELLVYVGFPIGFVVWACLVGRYYVQSSGKGVGGYAARCAAMVGFCTVLLTLATPFFTGGGQLTQTAGLWCRMKAMADVEGIRKWGETAELKTPSTEGAQDEGNYKGELPASIRMLRPGRVTVDATTRAVTIEWAKKGYGRWGLWVGEAGTTRGGEMRMGLKPGAYVWSKE